MPFLRKPQLQPVKGIELSVPASYLQDGQGFPQNMQYFRGEFHKRDGKSVFGGVSLGAQKILHLATFELTSGNIRLIRHTKTNTQKYNVVTGQWDDISGVDLTGGETDFFSSCVVSEEDLYLFTNGIDPIQKYNDAGITEALGGSPPVSQFIEYLTPYVLIANTSVSPVKIQWCNTGQPAVWTGGNSGSQLLSDEPSHIRGLKKLRDYAFVYKEKSVYRGRKVNSAAIFDFGGPFTGGKGLYSPRAIADDGENHYYMGLNDFHLNNGVRITDIGAPVREYIFNRLNRSRFSTCHALHVEFYKEVWFFITPIGSDWPTEVWKYNYETGFWYFDTVSNCITAMNYKQVGSLTWGDMLGTWGQQVIAWDDQQGAADAPGQIFGHDTGFTSKLDSNLVDDLGNPLDCRLETKDYTGLEHKGIEFDTRWLQFDVMASGDTLKLFYSTDYGATWRFVEEKALGPTVERITFYPDFWAKHVRFRMQADGLRNKLVLRSFTPYFLANSEMPT